MGYPPTISRNRAKFGFERGHYDVSTACAVPPSYPAIRDTGADTLVVVDGFSCRTQIEQARTGRQPIHTAELPAAALHGTPPTGQPSARLCRAGHQNPPRS